MMIKPKRFKLLFGFTMIEIFISMILGLMLLSGVLKILLSNRQAFDVQSALTRLYENGQYAMNSIARDLRNSDYWGCMHDMNKVVNHIDTNGAGYTPAVHSLVKSIEGNIAISGAGTIVAGTDRITLRTGFSTGGKIKVIAPYGPQLNSPLTVMPNNGLQQGDIIVVSDCLSGDLFEITNANPDVGVVNHDVAGTPGNLSNKLSKIYKAESFVFKTETISYSVQLNAAGRPALFRTSSAGNIEMISDIENLRFWYGEDTDADGEANRYVLAGNVIDFNNVVSIRVSLLAASQDRAAATASTYTFAGQNFMPTDKRIRQAYTTTVKLRNRTG